MNKDFDKSLIKLIKTTKKLLQDVRRDIEGMAEALKELKGTKETGDDEKKEGI